MNMRRILHLLLSAFVLTACRREIGKSGNSATAPRNPPLHSEQASPSAASASAPAEVLWSEGADSAEVLNSIAKALDWVPAGEVRTEDGKQVLIVDGVRKFVATRIGEHRRFPNGSLLVTAQLGTAPAIEDAELPAGGGSEPLKASAAEVWMIVDGAAEPKRLSPARVHAQHPIASKDGLRIAFTGRPLDERGLPGREILYVYDAKSASLRAYPEAAHKHDFTITPIKWEGDDESLIYATDYGETGGHMQIARKRF
jgi:hypothetical protein